MRVALAARLLYDEWKSRPVFTDTPMDNSYLRTFPRLEYLAFLKTQAQDSATDGHDAYKLACRWINEL